MALWVEAMVQRAACGFSSIATCSRSRRWRVRLLCSGVVAVGFNRPRLARAASTGRLRGEPTLSPTTGLPCLALALPLGLCDERALLAVALQHTLSGLLRDGRRLYNSCLKQEALLRARRPASVGGVLRDCSQCKRRCSRQPVTPCADHEAPSRRPANVNEGKPQGALEPGALLPPSRSATSAVPLYDLGAYRPGTRTQNGGALQLRRLSLRDLFKSRKPPRNILCGSHGWHELHSSEVASGRCDANRLPSLACRACSRTNPTSNEVSWRCPSTAKARQPRVYPYPCPQPSSTKSVTVPPDPNR